MKAVILIYLIVSLPMYMTLNCYQCAAVSRGCNDPFNKTGGDVTESGQISTNTYCKKVVLLGVVQRSGDSSCKAAEFKLNTGTACCQTDLCNGAHITYQIPIMLLVTLTVLLAKVQWH